MPTEATPRESGWTMDELGRVYLDANWPVIPTNKPPRSLRTYYKRASRRCDAPLEDGQRCAGPYHCPEH